MRYPTPARWRIRPISVHDGDTVRVSVDRGDDDQSVWDIRLKDVYAPELTQTGGAECRTFVAKWLDAETDGSDWPFLLETFRTTRSDVDVTTFSRLVGVVTAASGAVLNHDVQAFVTTSGYPGGVGS